MNTLGRQARIPIFLGIIRSVARAMRRDVGSFLALKVNNLFLFIVLLIWGNLVAGLPPRSAYPFLLLLAFVLLFPLSSDPLAKIPSVRMAMWPLSGADRAALRVAGIAMSPVFWIALALLWRTSFSLALAFIGLAVAMQSALALVRLTPAGAIAFPPALPGRRGLLISVALRQMFTVLDTYVALLVAIAASLYRFGSAAPDRAAYPIFSFLIALALSTYAQCQFGLDSPSAWTRYRLLPMTAREIAFAKDTAFLGVLLLLSLPLAPVAAMSFGFASLAFGRFAALRGPNPQSRWRFTGGRLPIGVLQMTVGAALGLAAAERGTAWALAAVAGYAISAVWAPTFNYRRT